MSAFSQFVQTDFSGGETDLYRTAQPNQYELADNYIITKDKTLDVRPGSDAFDQDNVRVDTYRSIGRIEDFNGSLIVRSVKNIYYYNSGWNEVRGATNNPFFAVGGADSNCCFSIWKNQYITTNDIPYVPTVLYRDSNQSFKAHTLGLPHLPTTPVVSGPTGSDSYVYYFTFYYTFKVETKTYIYYSTPTAVIVSSMSEPSSSNKSFINDIPEVNNGSIFNYDTDNIKVHIFRTVANGVVPYFVAELNNGTTTFEDEYSDTTISANAILYTEGGVVNHDPPPKCKYLTITNEVGLYAHTIEDGVILPYRVRFSVQGAIQACPEDFYIDMQDEIVGINSIEGIPIVFTKSYIYRIEGVRSATGSGAVGRRAISDYAGCINNNSIVRTNKGLYFAGVDGFYFTNGFEVQKITNNLDERYATYISDIDDRRSRIYGVKDKKNSRVYWAVTRNKYASQYNDSWRVFDETFGAFTSASNNYDTSYYSVTPPFATTALGYFNNQILRGHPEGYILKHDQKIYYDVVPDSNYGYGGWYQTHIPTDFKSILNSFGHPHRNKFCKDLQLLLKTRTGFGIQPYSISNDTKRQREFTAMRYVGNQQWSLAPAWNSESMMWGEEEIVKKKRHFPRSETRGRYKQIRLINDYEILWSSEDIGNVSVADVFGTGIATILDTTYKFPDGNTGFIDYFVSFSYDDYATEYRITSTSNGAIGFINTPAIPDDADPGYGWKVKGYRKKQAYEILSMIQTFKVMGDKEGEYVTGENADIT